MRSIFGKLLQQQLLGFLLQVDGGVQPGAAAADELEQHRAFVELGMNSAPSRVKTNSDEPNNTTAAATTQPAETQRQVEQRRVERLKKRTSQLSCSVILPRRKYEHSTGMSVSASTSAPPSAKHDGERHRAGTSSPRCR